jgi:hypothetical protein
MVTTCTVCGTVNTTTRKFPREYTFLFRTVAYCPTCWDKRQRQLALFPLYIWIALTCLGAVLLAVGVLTASAVELSQFAGDMGWLLLNVPLWCVLTCLMIVPHELAHALCAWLVGWRVFRISLGAGRQLCRFRVGALRVEINLASASGVTWMAPRNIACFRSKYFLTLLAGPAVNIVAVAALLTFVGWSRISNTEIPGTHLWFLLALLAANVILGIVSLVPHTTTMVFGLSRVSIPSDGRAMLTAPFLPSSAVQVRHAGYFATEGYECLADRRYEPAKRWFQKGLELYPEDVGNRFGAGYAHHWLRDFHVARDQWAMLLNRTDLEPAIRPRVLNNIAWVDLLIGGQELLNEAERYSEEAVAAEPWYPPLLGTRGSVLIDQGNPAAGLPLVRRAMDFNEEPSFKALNACYLALGEMQQGRTQAALEYRDLARRLDPECMLLERLDRATGIVGTQRGLHPSLT